jgi:hypothetical protein
MPYGFAPVLEPLGEPVIGVALIDRIDGFGSFCSRKVTSRVDGTR